TVGLPPLDQPKAESRPHRNSPASAHQLRRPRQAAISPISPAGGSVVPADKMLGVSTGQLLVILGACSVMMKPSDMIKMARVAGRMTGRAVGRLMLYRRQMDDIFEQTAAKKINTELQDAMSKLQSIGYEVQNLSRITPGQFIKRQHNTGNFLYMITTEVQSTAFGLH
uniref:Uncharacterized protein n=1 Tax=Aegilops tauschii subsp. strangulata TaxID=200361 RepID=A0A453E1U0_AEGTS